MGNKQILPQEKPGFSRLSGRGNRAENFLSQGAFPRLPTGGKYGTLSLVDTSLTKSPGPSTRPGEKHGCRGGPVPGAIFGKEQAMVYTRNISDSIVWVGGSDRRLALFENLFPIPRGVSYNSYVILDEKTALLDTVDSSIAPLR